MASTARSLIEPRLAGDVGLDEQHTAVGQDRPLARGAGGEQDRGGGAGLADTQGGHIGGDVPHGVVDRQGRRQLAAL